MVNKKTEQEIFIVEEETNLSQIFSMSIKLVQPKIIRKFIGNNIEQITINPLEPGLGTTIGHSLRRTLLSHIGGYAISAVKIKGCNNKFQNISGMKENICEILMNLKEVVIKPNEGYKNTAFFAEINVQGPGDVTAKDLIMSDATVVNPDHIICSLDVNGSFSAKVLVTYGRGYVVAENQKFQNTTPAEDQFLESALIMDSTYNQIKQVEYLVESSRVDERTDYDKLIITIETSGAINPEQALGGAYYLIYNQMKVLEQLDTSEIHVDEQEKPIDEINIPEYMYFSINKIGLPYRVQNTLALNNIKYVGDLVTKTEAELIRLARMGNESIIAIKQNLATSGLSLGMVIKGWKSENVNEIHENLENNTDEDNNYATIIEDEE